jgi:hypothetical protein
MILAEEIGILYRIVSAPPVETGMIQNASKPE